MSHVFGERKIEDEFSDLARALRRQSSSQRGLPEIHPEVRKRLHHRAMF
jgi:hypothetical protein